MRAFFDANVLASGILGLPRPESSTPGELFRRWRAEEFDLVISEFLLDEVRRALDSPYFDRRLTIPERGTALVAIKQRRVLVSFTESVTDVASHPEDDFVLATALSGEADGLVTGDRQLRALRQFRGIPIMSPREFLSLLEASEETSQSPCASCANPWYQLGTLSLPTGRRDLLG